MSTHHGPLRHGRVDPHPELDDDRLLELVRGIGNVPRHVAIIMDGNGRWARRRLLPRVAGHRAGRHSVRRCVQTCGRAGVEVLTLYTFSQENFNRPAREVQALWTFLEETLATEREELDRRDVRLSAVGELEQLPDQVRRMLDETIAALADNRGLLVNLALAYGGRQEIVRAAAALARRVADGELDPAAIGEEELRRGLYAPDLPDPDLVIRTSGEARLSNFLLWQAAYAELYITPVLWPDFGDRDLLLALNDFQQRERRFGALPDSEGDNGHHPTDAGLLDPARWRRLLKARP
ncbi:MAG: polyprenyl diphosphate synthase [Candidatus Krumholzibacteriia bacterium]